MKEDIFSRLVDYDAPFYNDNVSVNSKPDNPPPQQNPRAIFGWANSPPPGKKGVQNLHPRAYTNELKPHPRGHFPQLFAVKT